ncbi:hypothetical protein LTR84_004911 [Exophiala bonariae]|uniref:FAD-binding domain-containing protein n=1 Tax=Exophiala bonariae TaxID=1690606 RepID=A0AAV9NPX6_9EURO|nr:hypothetical protein LTR84_004911 [Exophiala bonariae]
MEIMHQAEVLIVGGGPTGLTLGLELALQGISFRIVDMAPDFSEKSKALAMQARSQELLSRHGLGPKLLKCGLTVNGATIVVKGKEVTNVQLGKIAGEIKDSMYAPSLVIAQSDTERVLHQRLLQYGSALERGVTVREITQDDTGATAVLENSSGVRDTLRVKYIVGTDGAHSTVRHASDNFTFEGGIYPQDFILCDAYLRSNKASIGRNLFLCLGQGVLVIFPLRDNMVRIFASRPGKPKHNPDLKDFQQLLDSFKPGHGELYDPIWMTSYSLHHRGVNTYRDRRLFVAGDAAHIHSPVGGQGMNTGIQDAVNLGWKLGAVLRGERPDSFLDTYHQERHPVGQHLLNTTDWVFTWLTWTNPIFMSVRNFVVPWVAPYMSSKPARTKRGYQFISELAIRYRKSPIVWTGTGFNGSVLGGNRAPDGMITGADGQDKGLYDTLSGVHHSLVLFSGTQSDVASAADLERARKKFLDARSPEIKADVYILYNSSSSVTLRSGEFRDPDDGLHRSYNFTTPGYAYIRPDYYVANIGFLSTLDELCSRLAVH